MRGILFILLLTISIVQCCAGDMSGGPIIESFRLEAGTPRGNILTRNLTAETTGSGDSTILRISAWDGDCSMSIFAGRNSKAFVREDGNLEWEITLAAPGPDPLIYPVNIQGLSCFRQPSLSPEEISAGCYRPDSVAGSYAFYHKAEKNNRIKIGGRDTTVFRYGTGKAFHLYTPYAWDVRGDTVKCSLYIDTGNESLEIYLPKDFAGTAEYPVTIDPQFGKTDVGSSLMLLGANYSAATLFNAPGSGVLDSFAVYVEEDGTPGTVGAAIYDDDGGCDGLRDTTIGMIATASPGWYQMKAAGEAEVSSGADYWLAAFCGGSPFNLRYDSYSGAETIRNYLNPWPPPDPCLNPTWNHPDRLVSIYAVYTTGGPDENEVSRRKRLLMEWEGTDE